MRIAVILPTRGKPKMLTTVINAFQHLSSGRNNIKYFVRVDTDEAFKYATFDQGIIEGSVVELLIAPAPTVVAEKVYDLIELDAFKAFDPDVHVLMSDDVLPMTQDWDVVMTSIMAQHDMHALCWTEVNDPNNTSYIILDKPYVEAMPSYLPTWFPFWFSDTWRAEVHMMAFGKAMPIVANLQLGGKRSKTYGMKDLKFWFEFFAGTRAERVVEAQVLARNFGQTMVLDPGMMAYFEQRDAKQLEMVPQYEATFKGDASPKYEQARSRAQRHLNLIRHAAQEVPEVTIND